MCEGELASPRDGLCPFPVLVTKPWVYLGGGTVVYTLLGAVRTHDLPSISSVRDLYLPNPVLCS